jgi:hypothetical protein
MKTRQDESSGDDLELLAGLDEKTSRRSSEEKISPWEDELRTTDGRKESTTNPSGTFATSLFPLFLAQM